MPKVINYTPEWLSSPNPGHEMFLRAMPDSAYPDAPLSNASSMKNKINTKPGPRRAVTSRGTEIFVAVGKEIRWANLVYVKEAWKDQMRNKASWENLLGKTSGTDVQVFRVYL